MREIPAACGNCGYMFPSGYGFDPGGTGVEANMRMFEGAPVSTPCPMCGRRRGRILAGEYQFVKDTITFLSGPEGTVKDLERLTALLRDAQESDANADEIREKAKAVGLSALVDKLLADRPTRMELQGWLTLLVATLSLLVALKSIGSAEEPDPSQAIYNTTNYNVTVQAPTPTNGRHAVNRIGRNDPCPCGSGKKFKKCHGSPMREAVAP